LPELAYVELAARGRAARRLVTGHRADGQSTVLLDAAAPNVRQRQAGNASTLLWVTDETPARVSGGEDRAAREIGVPPPRRGTIFRLAEFPPGVGGEVRDNETVLLAFSSLPKAVEFMQPAVLAGHILDVNKVAKFAWGVVQALPYPIMLNPSDEIFDTQPVVFVAVDPATAEAPDE